MATAARQVQFRLTGKRKRTLHGPKAAQGACVSEYQTCGDDRDGVVA